MNANINAKFLFINKNKMSNENQPCFELLNL